MTIASLFESLHTKIAVTDKEYAGYEKHRETVEKALANGFPGTTCDLIGSHARQSAIRSTSDQDFLARLPRSQVRSLRGGGLLSSDTVLRNVRLCLEQRFTTTAMGKDRQAIVVGFGAGARDVDIVPSAFDGMVQIDALKAKRPLLLIPNGVGGWLPTAPAAHNEYLALADKQSGHKLKYVAQYLRHWRNSRVQRIPILTFHAELVLAVHGTCNRVAGYSAILASAFQLLASRNGQALQDPLGVSGNIPIAMTPAKREKVVAHLQHAAEHSARALEFEQAGKLQKAQAQWSLVFNGTFPSR